MVRQKVKFNAVQRKHLADLLKDSANVILASLVIGQFVDRTISWLLIVLGGTLYVVLIIFTTRLQGGESHD